MNDVVSNDRVIDPEEVASHILPRSFRSEAHSVVSDEDIDSSIHDRGRDAQHHAR